MTSHTPRDCCVYCAQKYLRHPTLTCDPYHAEADAGVTRRVKQGCRDCRVRKRTCQPVPATYSQDLALLQSCADKLARAIADRKTNYMQEFLDLRDAQAAFSNKCPRLGTKNN